MQVRTLHYKLSPKNYPKVNILDVVLEKPRYGFRRDRAPLLQQKVTDTLFPAPEIRKLYKEAGKPVPIKFRANSDEIARRNYRNFKDEIAFGKPHFRVGEKQIYLPKARVCLLRPNAKHTPYQAKFLVPRNFNKMDLRDYLWNVYGLRALNVTVQLLPAKFSRSMDDHARYRVSQYKKMTIDMEEPFIWPELPADIELKNLQFKKEQGILTEKLFAEGSNVNKPNDAMGGLYNKPDLPDVFVSAKVKKTLLKNVKNLVDAEELQRNREVVRKMLNL